MANERTTAWERVEIARNPKRKTALDYIENIFDEFIELHGDRNFKDDKAIVCGLGRMGDRNFTIIAEQKGRTTKENIERNFGMPNPESYRKAIRFMKQAEKFKRPVITFIDTKGAYPGIGAEERGQGEAIAKSMFEMAKLKVPIIAIVIGEGSSGGALAIGVANKVIMLENAIYSILSPEGYSSILWKDSSRYKEAAEKMKLTAKDLYDLKVIDTIIKEEKLPYTLTSYSPCFRKEKGAHGIEERGVYRIHQFEKQEMIVVCKPEESPMWYEKMWQNTVDLFRSLDIPVRTLECCSGDLADLKVKSCDVEAWSPRQKKYFEVGSCSNLGDAQARRLKIRVDGPDGKYFAHTLNNTVVAPPRMLIAFLENNLMEDGSVRIPDVLRPYMGGMTELREKK